ncbi:MAG: S-methyl-5'-thioadenosine phosphorylase [Candidatus Schekmanbacteria bacterium]|nr:S-methyl-5'-thioadenosine phosphorylase [Candidatus Schekmanbacteria bacterium]
MRIGIIGGSGLYAMEGLQKLKPVKVKTPFGDPSDDYMKGVLEGKEVVFLPRHGRGHRILPSELNYRANIYGFKKLGVDRIISVSAVGSMREEIKPLDIVIPDQFFDRTKDRPCTFFGEGVVGHVSFADPICNELAGILYQAGKSVECRIHLGGTYICIEGPQFSSRAESRIYRQWGVDVIGMTNLTEAKLAREAEICYTTMALATDYDVWHDSEEDVTAEAIIAILHKNVANAQKLIINALKLMPKTSSCNCKNALKDAIITAPDLIPDQTRKNLNVIMGRYWK